VTDIGGNAGGRIQFSNANAPPGGISGKNLRCGKHVMEEAGMMASHQPVGGDSCMPPSTFTGDDHEKEIFSKADIVPSSIRSRN